MSSYYVNKNAQPTGEHEVHNLLCRYLPVDKIHLGYFSTCAEAVRKAKEYYNNVDGCAFCCSACHTR